MKKHFKNIHCKLWYYEALVTSFIIMDEIHSAIERQTSNSPDTKDRFKSLNKSESHKQSGMHFIADP